MFGVTAFDGDGNSYASGTARTLAKALRGAWGFIRGVPDAEVCIRRYGPGLVAFLSTNHRGELQEAEVYAKSSGHTLVTPLNPRGPLFPR
jgi:hypothetical protein